MQCILPIYAEEPTIGRRTHMNMTREGQMIRLGFEPQCYIHKVVPNRDFLLDDLSHAGYAKTGLVFQRILGQFCF